MSFIDQTKTYVKAGDGGKGCFSFYFHKPTARRVPDGGDGGDGGDVIIKVNQNLWDLTHLKYKKHQKAERGHHGGSNNKTGKRGKDKVIEVPQGTVIRDLGNSLLIRDLSMPADYVAVAKGGRGGRGNGSTKSELRAPKPGEEKNLFLELKLLAQVGLVGFPNAGKTTFLNTLCQTKGRIASYPFTTLEPQLGVIWHNNCAVKIADIPGLIEGAHRGKGLGHLFLKHIQRTEILVFILGLDDTDPDPLNAFEVLRGELEKFNPALVEKKFFVIANKMDLPCAEKKFQTLTAMLPTVDLLPVSLASKTGLIAVKDKIAEYFN
ncbi:MAG: GTPase ObgE [Candidatus Omnitrophica bacterium]|nr:GTPase ObgE [Candidatus Omnitrophota bacterium]